MHLLFHDVDWLELIIFTWLTTALFFAGDLPFADLHHAVTMGVGVNSKLRERHETSMLDKRKQPTVYHNLLLRMPSFVYLRRRKRFDNSTINVGDYPMAL